VIVVVNKEPGYDKILSLVPEDKIIFDLVNIDFRGRKGRKNYHGVSW
jgi:hypothetical protein